MRVNREQLAILKEAINVLGVNTQTDKAIEEMSQLAEALNEFKTDANAKSYERIQDKLADVWIMMCQLLIMYGDTSYMSDTFNSKRTKKFMDKKISELRHKIKN